MSDGLEMVATALASVLFILLLVEERAARIRRKRNEFIAQALDAQDSGFILQNSHHVHREMITKTFNESDWHEPSVKKACCWRRSNH